MLSASRGVLPSQSRSSFSPSTQLLKEGPHVVDEQARSCLGGKMVASVIDIPGDDVLVITLRKEPNGLIDVGKIAQAERDGGRFSWDILRVSVLVVQASRGCRRVRQPVDHHVREDVVVTLVVSV